MLTEEQVSLIKARQAIEEAPVHESLEAAENAFFEALDTEENAKMTQVVLILNIKRYSLYRQRVDMATGEPFSSFESYLKSIEPELERRGVGKSSSIKKAIARYRVYCEQLGYTDDWLQKMGSHAQELIALANLTHFDSVLEYDNAPTEYGGEKLGVNEFKEAINDIESKLESNDPNAPELDWKVSDTRAYVREKLGKPDPVSEEWNVQAVDDEVQVKSHMFLVDGEIYEFYAKKPIPKVAFLRFAKGKIVGLEEDK